MPEDWSEENIKKNCPHCDRTSPTFDYFLEETGAFWVTCDPNPIVEGHILVIPKKHLSCVGEYSEAVFQEFSGIDGKISGFLRKTYGVCSSFEHGKLGQTVFHSHVHYLPFQGNALDIVPEGNDRLTQLKSLSNPKSLYEKSGGYLYFSTEDGAWIVDPSLAAPRFFRDRFASALGRPERGNWKDARKDVRLMDASAKDCLAAQSKWKRYVLG